MRSQNRLACILLLALNAAGAASAADYLITTVGNWSTATWTPGTPLAGGGADYTIISGKTSNNSFTNDLGAGSPKEFLLNSVVWAAGGPLFAGDQLAFVPNATIQPSIVYASTNTPNRAFPFYNPIRIQDGATLTVNGNGSDPRGASIGTGYQFRGAISGAADVVINGTSVQDDSKDYVMYCAANTYSGTTFVNSGVLQLGDGTSGNDGSIAGLSLVNNGSVIYNLAANSTYGGVLSGDGGVTKSGSAVLILTETNTYAGTTTISSGTLRLGNGNSGKDGILANSLSVVNNGTLEFRRFGNQSYGGVISGTGAVTKSGAGTQTLTGANSYSGTTTVNAGVLNIQNNTALGTVGNTTVASAGTLQLEGDLAVNEVLRIAGAGAAGQSGALVNVSGASTWTGRIWVDASAKIAVDAGTLLLDNDASGFVFNATDSDLTITLAPAAGAALTVGNGDENIFINGGASNLTLALDGVGSGALFSEFLGGGGHGTLVKNGAGTWTLNRAYAANRGWRDGVQVNGGTLKMGVADALSYLDVNSTVQVNDGATLDLAGNNTRLVGLGNVAGNTLGLVTNSGAGPCVLTVGEQHVTSTFEGVIRDGLGAIGLSKTGTNTFTLAGANTYSGETTVSAGTLLVNGSIGSGPVTVAPEATLGGNGVIGGVATISGVVSPGVSIGTLTFSSAPVLNGATLMQLNKNASPNADKLVLSSGTLIYGGTLKVEIVDAALAGGEVFDLFDAPGNSFSGGFTLDLPTLPQQTPALNWFAGNLMVDGTLKVNRKPASGADTLSTRTNTPVSISLVELKANDSDADGDPLSITDVGNALPVGASVALAGGIVTYTPKAESAETGSFEYTLDDGHFGVVTVTVNVTVTSSTGGSSPIVVYGPVKEGNDFVVRFEGNPGSEYTVERAENLTGPWTKKENKTAPTDNTAGFGVGVFELRDTIVPGSRFYRTVSPSY